YSTSDQKRLANLDLSPERALKLAKAILRHGTENRALLIGLAEKALSRNNSHRFDALEIYLRLSDSAHAEGRKEESDKFLRQAVVLAHGPSELFEPGVRKDLK